MPRNTLDVGVPDLSGKLAVITGANSGLGFGLTEWFARTGAEVVLAVRNPTKGEDAAARIRARVPGVTLSIRQVDLASLTSVHAAGDQLVGELPGCRQRPWLAGEQADDGVHAGSASHRLAC